MSGRMALDAAWARHQARVRRVRRGRVVQVFGDLLWLAALVGLLCWVADTARAGLL